MEAAPRREIGLREAQAGGRRKRGCPGCDMGAGGTAPGFEQRSEEVEGGVGSGQPLFPTSGEKAGAQRGRAAGAGPPFDAP